MISGSYTHGVVYGRLYDPNGILPMTALSDKDIVELLRRFGKPKTGPGP